MSQVEDRVTRLEILIETNMNKIIEGLDSLSVLMIEADDNKAFRKKFEEEVLKLVKQKLNTKEFDDGVKETAENTVYAVFNKPEIRKDFEYKVQAIIQSEFDKLLLKAYVKLTLVIGGISTSLALVIMKGVLQ